ncbi:RluA family pseudouridine synthase [Gorillibacterium timonense]|uniref:RluA family pseudouridine synthase n=1 Tax=Gorillibacterium timonense TaxID=1689269 RepID=UPI00071D5250|nr:RluA family pseudouridine synthase [Gorillibacterium timonense]
MTKETEAYYEPLVYLVPEADAGMKLGTVLKNRMGISRTLMTRLKQSEQGLTVNGLRTYTNAVVHPGDRVEARMQREVSEDIQPEEMELAILHEDEYLLILNKPPGLIVHPTHGHYTGTLANGVVWHWRQKGETVRFRPVHRLDQETSGVLAIAKNPYVHQSISEQMQKGIVTKEYVAVVHGKMTKMEGTVDAPIDRNPDNPRVRIVSPEGDRAVTHYRVAEAHPAGSVVHIRLETGRTHQIRVHMRHLGHPLFGDKMYGPGGEAETGIIPGRAADFADETGLSEPIGRECDHAASSVESNRSENPEPTGIDGGVLQQTGPSIPRQALHAEKLGFIHPGTGCFTEFRAPLPADMEELIAQLREGDEG